MSRYRLIEWCGTGAGQWPGRREPLPKAEAEEHIAAGRAIGITLVRLKTSVGACNPGEMCGWPDHVARRLIELDQAEPVPVAEPALDHAPAGNVDGEAKGLTAPPQDRMLRTPAVRKEQSS
jgi:hypothetical protein